MKKYFIWTLSEANVPTKILETEHADTFKEYIASLMEDNTNFAARMEGKD